MYPRITKLIFDEWQELWNCCAGNKLHAIRPTVGDYKEKTCLSRRDSVLLNRLHIGHTCLTHSFLLSGDDLPECSDVNKDLTFKAKDKDETLKAKAKDQDKDQTFKAKDQDKD